MTSTKTSKTPAKSKDQPGTDLETIDQAALDAINAAQEDELDDDLTSIPILKIGQPLTKEVQEEQAAAGEFINSDSGEGIGNKVEFIPAYFQKGRFAADRDTNRAYVAFGSTIPDHWADLVGEEFVGTPFAEHPDAEETFKKRVNAKEIAWGKGPLISTTYNFTGYALVEDVETGETEPQPVRISLQRTGAKAAKAWLQLRKTKLRNKSFWDKTFILSTEKESFDKGMAYLLKVAVGRDTNTEEKTAGFQLAQAVLAGRIRDNSDAPEERSEVDAKGGLAV